MFKCTILIVVLALLSCGGHKQPAGDIVHIVEDSETEENLQVLFSSKLENSQYCFYEKSVTRGELFAQDGIMSYGSESRKNDVPVTKTETDDNHEYMHELNALAAGSSLLTPRSIDERDLQSVLRLESRWLNRAANVKSYAWNPISIACIATAIPVVLFPIVSIGPVTLAIASVSCSVGLITTAISYAFFSKSSREAGDKTNKLVATSFLHLAPRAHLQKIKKIFTWLESRDHATCPTQIQLFKPQDREEG